MRLPSLGRISPPAPRDVGPLASSLLGPPPEPPPTDDVVVRAPANQAETQPAPGVGGGQTVVKSRTEVTLERRLTGPAFSRRVESGTTGESAALVTEGNQGRGESSGGAEAASSFGAMASLLKPTVTATVRASVLPTQRLLLPKGTFIDCTLETAIDSTLPGLTTCVMATDVFGADGKVVLLERGTKLVGETRGEVGAGSARVFVLWTEARTPTGVVVPLASPGTDELGRSGLASEVNRHFWQRFGAAMLISVIDGTLQGAVASRGSGTVVVNPSGSEQIVTEVLRGTVNIPPTVRVENGSRVQILVARDVDFRSVYELRAIR